MPLSEKEATTNMLVLADLLNSAITGIFVGFGSGIGAWLATRAVIRHLEGIAKNIERKEAEETHAEP